MDNRRPVPDKETGIAGEFVGCLGDYLDRELLSDEFAAGRETVEHVRLVQPQHHKLRVGAFAERRASRELSWDSLASVRTDLHPARV
jgi:hypothetical protein